jgi:hypothetical protein
MLLLGELNGGRMSKLFTFLENFDMENQIRIYDENSNLIYEGAMGDVPQRISNMMSVIRGTAIWKGNYLEVKVKKC